MQPSSINMWLSTYNSEISEEITFESGAAHAAGIVRGFGYGSTAQNVSTVAHS